MPTVIRVLILENQPADVRLIAGELRRAGFEPDCKCVDTEEGFRAGLETLPDVILADYTLPQFDAPRALALLRAAALDIPLIIVTGTIGEELAVAAMREGAADYLLKDRLGRLGPAVSQALAQKQLRDSSRETELALRESLSRTRLILDTANDSFVTMDLEGHIIDWNAAAESTFGWTRSEVLGRSMAETIIPGAYRARHLNGLAQFRATGDGPILRRQVEVTALRRDGREFPAELTVWPVWHGSECTFSAFIRDISERQRSEKLLLERTQLAMLSADVGLALNRSSTLRQMLQECAASMVVNLEACFARIWTLNAAEDVLELQASAGLYTHLDGPHSRMPVGSFKIGVIARECAPHLTNDVCNDPLVSDKDWARREGMVAFAGYPLLVENRLVGVMAMFARHALGQATLDAMAVVANQIAAGIERKRSEERLQFTQFTIDHVATAVFWTDERGQFFHVNDAACQLTGYSRSELLRLGVFELDASVTAENWSGIWNSMRQRHSLTLESQLRRRDGRTIPIGVTSNLLKADGREYICTFVQDISELRQSAEAQRLLAAERDSLLRRLQVQIQRMPLAYMLCDADLRIIDWNPAAERIFGFRAEEVLGMGPPYEKILPPTSREAAAEVLDRLRAGDMTANAINENLTKDGRTISCEWFNTPLVADDGSFAGIFCLAQDISERKRLEEQFRQAQKMEAVGKLAGGVAHDFNNLLTIISGYSDIVLESMHEQDPLREMIEQIRAAGARAARLTRQLLAFSRKQVLAPVVLDLNNLLTDMEKMLVRLIGEDVELAVRLEPALWSVRVDPGQMEQVVLNLAVNARDAMPRGGKLTLQTTNVELDADYAARHPTCQPGEHILLSVSDNGCGMDRATMARIFEPFFTTKGPEQGTGLGLATVYGIVNQSGGFVDVYSEVGLGTTFKIFLPRNDAAGASPAGSEPAAMPPGAETVLLVEDEPGVRTLAHVLLHKQGYQVLEAQRGDEALQLCARHPGKIDVLMTDVVMPGMSGRELAERMVERYPAIKVIYMSGYTDDAVVRHGILTADAPFLQKPFTPSALARKVREVLDRKPALV